MFSSKELGRVDAIESSSNPPHSYKLGMSISGNLEF